MAKRDQFSDFFRNIFEDIRKHVIDEAWFGRGLHAELRDSNQPAQAGTSFAEQLGWQRPSGRDAPEHQQEHGIDH